MDRTGTFACDRLQAEAAFRLSVIIRFARPGRMVYFAAAAWILARHRVSARPSTGRVSYSSLRSIPGSRSIPRSQDSRRSTSGRFKWSLRGCGVLSGQDPGHAGRPAGRGGPEVRRPGQGGHGEARCLPRGLPARDHDLLPWPRRPGGAGDGGPDRTPAGAAWDRGRHPALYRLRDRVLDNLVFARGLRGACAQDHRHPELGGDLVVRGPFHEVFLLPAACRLRWSSTARPTPSRGFWATLRPPRTTRPTRRTRSGRSSPSRPARGCWRGTRRA